MYRNIWFIETSLVKFILSFTNIFCDKHIADVENINDLITNAHIISISIDPTSKESC